MGDCVIVILMPYYYGGIRGEPIPEEKNRYGHIPCDSDYVSDYDSDHEDYTSVSKKYAHCTRFVQYTFVTEYLCEFHYSKMVELFQKQANQYALTLQVIRGMTINDVCDCIAAVYTDLVGSEIRNNMIVERESDDDSSISEDIFADQW